MSTRVPANVIFIWTGTNASIPSGYTRETSLDDKYLKGNDVSTNPNTTGGALTHTHTSPSHTHSISAHTHTLSFGGDTGTNIDSGASAANGLRRPHTHPSRSSGAVANASVSSVAATYDAIGNNNHPPYYEVIFIKSDGSRGIPDNAVGLFDGTTIPTNWKECDGNNSTPNLTNKYLKGASAGADAGTTGGSLTHQHTLNHGAGHSVSHTHSQVTVAASASQRNDDDPAANDMVKADHTHTVSLNAYADSITSNATIDTSGDTVEPAYKKLVAIQNQNAQESTPKGIIGLWLGTLANIPTGWSEVTAMNNRFLKIASNTGEIGDIGGNNTHTHGSIAHQHAMTHGSGDHTATISGHSETTRHDGNSVGGSRGDGVHNVTVGSASATLQNSNTTANSTNNEPPYRTTAFIKLTQTADAGFLFNFV